MGRVGVRVLDQSGQLHEVRASAVLLATSARCIATPLIRRWPPATVAAMVAIAPAPRMSDMEFVQFHPTALFLKNAPRFLLSEALRGEGASCVTSS